MVCAVVACVAPPEVATRGGCGDMTGFAGACGAAAVSGFAGACGVVAAVVGFAGALLATAALTLALLVAGRGAAPIDGLPATTGDAVVDAATGGFGACAGTTDIAGPGDGVVPAAATLAAGVCAEVAMPGRTGARADPWATFAAGAAPGLATGCAAGLAAAGAGCPGDPPLTAGPAAGTAFGTGGVSATAFGTGGVSVPVLVVVGGFGGDAGPPPPA
jgi:hypothetical protein